MKEAEIQGGRRLFLKGLLTGAGLAGALLFPPRKAAAIEKRSGVPEPILYRRTKHVEKYYRTLYY